MNVFVCVILIALGNGDFKTVVPTGEAWKTTEGCKQETKHCAQDDDVTVLCVSVNKEGVKK